MSKKFLLSLTVLLLIIIAVFGFSAFQGHTEKALAQTALTPGPHALKGYAWSSNLGWVEFNPTFGGVFMDGTTGALSGYAWTNPRDDIAPSNNIGWLNFNTNNSCGGSAKVSTTSGAVTGWADYVSADNNGWDGCVHLSNSGNVAPYTSTVTNNQFTPSSYFWGGPSVTGWIHLCGATYCVSVDTATTSLPTAPSAPANVAQTNTGCDPYGGTIVLNITPGQNPPTTGGGYYIYRNGSATPTGISYSTTFSDSGLVAGQTYTYKVSAFNAGAGQVIESAKTSLSGTATASSQCTSSNPISISCVPANINRGATTVVKWTTSKNSCTLSGTNGDPSASSALINPFNPNAATSTQFTTSPLQQSTDYTLTCGKFTAKVTCSVTPKYTEF